MSESTTAPGAEQATHGLPADAWAHIASFLDHSDDFFCLLAALSDDAVTRACMHLPLPEWLPASKQDDGSEPTWAQWASLRHEELELDQLPEEHITLASEGDADAMIDALQCLAESARVVTLTIIDEEQRMPFEYGMLHAIAAMRELRWLSAEFTVSIECAFMNTVNASPLSALSQLQHAELRFSFNDCESAYQAPVTSAVDTLQWDGAPSLHTLIVWGAYEVRLSGFPSLRRAMHWQHQGWGKDGPATAVEPRGGAVDLTPLRETGSLCHTEDPWES